MDSVHLIIFRFNILLELCLLKLYFVVFFSFKVKSRFSNKFYNIYSFLNKISLGTDVFVTMLGKNSDYFA
jgi:hypothetical protein